eukprot:1030325_1
MNRKRCHNAGDVVFVTFHRFWLHWNNEIYIGDYECVTLFIVAVMLFLYIGFIMDLHRMESNQKHIDMWCMMVHFGINLWVVFARCGTQMWAIYFENHLAIHTQLMRTSIMESIHSIAGAESHKVWDPGGVPC